MKILPVIMSGGSGTRLWPASTDEHPKQLHAFGSSATMLQNTVQRVLSDQFLPPLVICNHRHGAAIIRQLASIGVEPSEVILEPFGRNTAAVGVIAAGWAKKFAPGAPILLMPADHVIVDDAGFRELVVRARGGVADNIIAFGIMPTAPETGYGYIQAGDPIADGAMKIRRFVEKPVRALAEAYLAEGGYSWNAGIFLYDPTLFLAEAERLCPEVVTPSLAALERASVIDCGRLLDPDDFRVVPAEAIDVAVMEKTDRAAVVPCSVGWADIGSWSELWRHGAKDDAGNHTWGDTVVLDASGSLIWSNGPSISLIGLSDIVVVATADHVLVLPKHRAQDVKALVERRRSKS